ncbi:BamA/TamA family outer membrane protein [Ulvibacterium sp.]|uniref:translocation and assembly module lipoprotein TamL n=1 Tax=Ulvibacterium sp. TaxID=2665914 RepID=UPI003BAA4AB8
MRMHLGTIGTRAKISLLLIGFAITSCNTLKRVGEDELLLVKNTIYADSLKVTDEDIESLIIQKPNSSILGYPLRLNLYNIAKKNPDSSYQDWLYRKPKRKDRLDNFLSEKQVERLGESFLVKGLSVWLKRIGEAPVIIDTSNTRKSLERLSIYYGSKGYFNNNTTFEIDSTSRKKRAKINYRILLGEPYTVDSISHSIASSAIDSLYALTANESFVEEGKQFDLGDFNAERERLASIFRNSGVYDFQESSISYNIIRDTTKMGQDRGMDVELNIDNLKRRSDTTLTTSEYKIHRFDRINIYTDYLYSERDSEQRFTRYGNYTIFYHNKLRFKPETLADAIFFEKDSIYRDLDRTRTYRQINNLNVFKYPTITFEEDSTRTKLTSNIYLAPRPKYSLGMGFDVTHSNIQRVGLAFSPSLQARNLFKGAENLSLTGRLNVGSSSDPTILDSRFFNILEFGADLNLDFPRIWFPFLNTKKIIPSYTLPRTRISLGTSFQQNIGLDKQTFNSILSYNWSPSDFRRNTVELLNIQFVRNVNTNRFFNVYRNSYDRLDEVADDFEGDPALTEFFETPEGSTDPRLIIPEGTTGFTQAILTNEVPSTAEQLQEVNSIEERRIRLTENNLIFASNYTFHKNNRNGLTDNNFFQFRWTLESAGNLLSGFANFIPFNKNDDGDLLVFSVPYSQYIKSDIDYVKYWDLSRSKVLAFHTFIGIAVPYGNSTNIPFVRSYFAGGSNDNRAWFPYSLGPGKTNAINDFNEANFKLAFNLEYRFPIVGDIKGALFADAGNIWNVFDDQEDPDAVFDGFEDLGDIALGTGFGLRYDFTYFLFRVDLGFKTYNPAEEPSKRWFRDYNFANSVLQIGINYPF